MAAELHPGTGHSIRLADLNGIIYYTVEPDGYRVVATVASGAVEPPVRFIATLGPGKRMVISVSQSVDQPPIDLEFFRNGDRLLVRDPVSAEAAGLAGEGPSRAALIE